MQGRRRLQEIVLGVVLFFGMVGAADAAGSKAQAPVPAGEPTIDTDYARVIAPLVASNTWAFFVSCRLPESGIKHVLVFPVGSTKGFYGEFLPNGWQQQGADVTVGKTVDVDEFMGGAQTMAIQMTIVKGLLRSPFQLVEPSRLEHVFKSQPVTRICDRYRG